MDELMNMGYMGDMHDDIPFEIFEEIFAELGYTITDTIYEALKMVDPMNPDP
jgi:hypothetical protein